MTTQEKIDSLTSVIETSDAVLTAILTALSGMRSEVEYNCKNWDLDKVIDRTEALETVVDLALKQTKDALYGELSVVIMKN
jgi:hypothetical protein